MKIRLTVFGAALSVLCAASAMSAAPDGPRIVRLSVAPTSAAAQTIFQPVGADLHVAQPPEKSSRRSSFVPVTLPEVSGPPQSAPPPELSARPAFAQAEEPPVWATTQIPQLTRQNGVVLAPAMSEPIKPAEPLAVAAAPAPAWPVARQPIVNLASQPSASPTHRAAAMQVVAERALQKAEHASAMAQRGMLYSAQTELIQTLQLIAQALDVQEGTSSHSAALAAGLTALEEARDFSTSAGRPGDAANMQLIAATHRTQLLPAAGVASSSPVTAQQQYFGFAQARLIEATGRLPAGSNILYRLGRLQTALAAHDADPLALHGPQAIVYHQAALESDGGNWLAANELGVLYARYGQLPAARQLLLASVTMHPHVAGWQNLAAVHLRLGERDLAERANAERQLLASKIGTAASVANDMVRWVDPQTFAASGGSDVRWPASVAAKPAAASSAAARR